MTVYYFWKDERVVTLETNHHNYPYKLVYEKKLNDLYCLDTDLISDNRFGIFTMLPTYSQTPTNRYMYKSVGSNACPKAFLLALMLIGEYE